MHFTHYMPGHTGQTPMGARFLRTMQIYSINVTETKGFALEWPLEVYGVVAARDMVDYRRNLLFLRTRDDCQILTKEVRNGTFLFFYFLLPAALLTS